MRLNHIIAVGGFVAAMASSPAMAGCYSSECYQKVVTPAQYGTVAETVMVRPAAVRRHVTRAEYGTVVENVVVRPERVVARMTPAVTQTVAEQVMVSPGGRVWQVSRDAYGREVGCWVSTPAQYGVRHRTVVVQGPQVVHETIPAVVAQRARTVMTRPAQAYDEVIPASYATRHHTVEVTPATASWQRMW